MKIKILFWLLLVSVSAVAQLKLGNNQGTRNINSILEMEHTTKGMLLPRVSLTSTTSYSPLSAAIVAGFVIYNTNASVSAGSSSYPINSGGTGLYYWDGSGWVAVKVADALSKANNLSDLANAGTGRANLGVAIGTNVQAYDVDLDDLADGSLSGSKVGTGIDGGSITTGTVAAARVATLNQNTTGTAANLSGTPALPNGTTATTQSTGDNSTKLATTAYVDDAKTKTLESIEVAFSDEATAITTGTAKVTFYMPYAMTVTEVFVGLSTAQSSGSIFTVDINEAGSTILSTKLTVDNTESGSNTAATAAVVSDTSLAKWAKMTIDVDQSAGTATGGKIIINGYRQ